MVNSCPFSRLANPGNAGGTHLPVATPVKFDENQWHAPFVGRATFFSLLLFSMLMKAPPERSGSLQPASGFYSARSQQVRSEFVL